MPSCIQKYAKNHLTVEQVEQPYIEKDLAQKLRNSTKEERQYLHTYVYNELFQKIPFHPQLINRANSEANLQWSHNRTRLIREFLPSDATFLEVELGDCCLVLEVVNLIRKVYIVDSNEITKNISFPQNMELAISDSVNIPLPSSSVNVVYSGQLMELHPEYAIEQLHNIDKVLALGRVYICHNPNRLSGSHDISGCYDETATGFHLQE
ncbi:hypothetical protein ABN584_15660 [Gloeocapsa sp. BRSZ]